MTGLKIYLKLLTYVKPYIGFFILSLLGFCFFAVSQPAFAKLFEYLITALDGSYSVIQKDLYFLPSSWLSSIYIVPSALIFITCIRSIGSFLGTYYLGKIAFLLIHDLRSDLFNHLILMPKKFFDNHSSGYLLTHITYNVNLVTNAATDAIRTMVREGLTVFFLITYLLFNNWKLASIFFLMTPVIALLVIFASHHFRRLSTNIQNSMGHLTHVSSEVINGYQTMKNYAGEAYEKKRFQQASQANCNKEIKMLLATSINTPTIQLLVNLSLAILFLLLLMFKNDASTASIVSFVTAAALLPKPIRQLSDVNAAIQRGIAAAHSIFNLIDQPTEVDDGTYAPKTIKGELQFNNVSFRYPESDRYILKNLNFIIKPGQTIAIIGRSGSGKSTLVKLISRFYDGFEGEISIDNHSIRDYSRLNLRHHIALIDQNITLFNDTVRNNIAYGSLSNSSDTDVKIASDLAYATPFIEQLPKQFDTLIGENGTILSGGQHQRIGLARAFLKDAPMLILDEATSALDNQSEKLIQSAINNITKDRTTIIITHRLSTIKNADILLVLDQGRIIEQGTHQELVNINNGYYHQLYHSQFYDNSLNKK